MTQLPPKGLVIVEEVSNRIERLPNSRLRLQQQPSQPQNSHHAAFVEEEEVLSTARQPAETTETVAATANQQVRVVKPVGQHSDWRALKDQPLWKFFDKVREIHRAYPDNEPVAKLHHEIKQELFDRYLPDTIRQVSSYFARKMPKFSLLHEGDLQEGAKTALWKYLDKYDPNYGTITFMQFFNAKGKSRLLGSIFDSLRALQEFQREIAKQRRELKPMLLALTQKLRHRPTPEEFCDEYGWDAVGSSGKTYREIVTDPLFYSGVFNQRQVASSLDEGMNEDEVESLSNHEARPAKNVHRLQSTENKRYILSLLDDEDMQFIIDCYYWQHDTNEKICFYLNQFGKKCSLSWVVSKHNEAKAVLRERIARTKLESMIPGWEL